LGPCYQEGAVLTFIAAVKFQSFHQNGVASAPFGWGGQNWGVVAPTQALATISGNEMVIVAEYGEGKMVLVANEYPFRNPQSGYSISFDDNEILVENIWDWLLE